MPATIDSLAINITANAKGANRSLNNLTKNLESLGKALGGVDTKKMQSLANSIKTIGDSAKASSAGMQNLTKATSNTANNVSRTTTAVKLFSSHTTTLGGKMKALNTHTFSLARTFGILYANLFLVIRAYKKLEEYIESSMDYVETYNYFSVTLDKIGKEFSYMYDRFGYEDAEVYAESFSARLNDLTNKMTGYAIGENGESILTTDKNLGLDLNTVMNFQAKTAAITNSVGLVGEASVITSEALTMLASDLSSFTNQDIDTVMTNLTSGLVGQSRALYKYGIDITSTTLETYALANGISKAVSEMTQAEKMQLRELAILDQSKVAWGDQANTLNSVANQYRMFGQATANLGRTVGNLFLPIVQKALPYVNGLVIALNRLFTSLGMNLWGDNWLTELMDGISSGYSDAGAEALEDYTDDLTGAADAAEEYKNQLLGFDEINKLQPIDESTSGSGSGVVDLTEQLQLALADYKKVWQEAFDNAENLAQQYAEAIYNGFKKSPLDLGTSIASWINGKIEDSDWTEIGTTIGNKISYIPTLLSGVAINLEWGDLGTRLGEAFEGISDAIPWETVGAGIGSTFTGIFKAGGAFFKKVNWESVAKNVASGINSALQNIKGDDIADAVNSILNAAITVAGTLVKELSWGDFFRIIGETIGKLDLGTLLGIVSLGTAVMATLKTSQVFINSVKEAMKTAFTSTTVVQGVAEAGTTFGSGLAEKVKAYGGWFALGTAIGLAITGGVLWVYDNFFAETFTPTNADVEGTIGKDLYDAITEAREKMANISSNASSRLDIFNNSTSAVTSIEAIANAYLKLRSVADPTEAEKATMEGYYNYLCDTLPDFADSVSDVNVSYAEQKKVLDGIISNMKRMAFLTAAQNALSGSAEDYLKIKQQLDALDAEGGQERLEELQNRYYEIEKEQSVLKNILGDVNDANIFEKLSASKKLKEAGYDFSSYDEAKAYYENLNTEMTDVSNSILALRGSYSTLTDSLDDVNAEMEYFSQLISIFSNENGVDLYEKYGQDAINFVGEATAKIGTIPSEAENAMKNAEQIASKGGESTVQAYANSVASEKSKTVLSSKLGTIPSEVENKLKQAAGKGSTYGAQTTTNFANGVSSTSAKNILSSKLGTIPSEVENKLKQAANAGSTQGSKVLNNLAGSNGLGNAAGLGKVSSATSKVASTVTGTISTIASTKNTEDVSKNVLTKTKNGLWWSTGLDSLSKAASNVTGKVTAIGGAMNKTAWETKSKNVLEGLGNGLGNVSLLNIIRTKITNLASSLGSYFSSILGIHSPSTVFESYGRFIDIGLANGIEGNLGYVSSATASLGSVTSDFGLSLPSLSGSASYTVSTSTSGGFLEQIAGAVAVAMQNANITINPSYEVKVGNERLTGVVVKEINRQTISTGKSPILI